VRASAGGEVGDRVPGAPERPADGLVEHPPGDRVVVGDQERLVRRLFPLEPEADRVDEIVDVDRVADAAAAGDDVRAVLDDGARETGDPLRARPVDDPWPEDHEPRPRLAARPLQNALGAGLPAVVRDRVSPWERGGLIRPRWRMPAVNGHRA